MIYVVVTDRRAFWATRRLTGRHSGAGPSARSPPAAAPIKRKQHREQPAQPEAKPACAEVSQQRQSPRESRSERLRRQGPAAPRFRRQADCDRTGPLVHREAGDRRRSSTSILLVLLPLVLRADEPVASPRSRAEFRAVVAPGRGGGRRASWRLSRCFTAIQFGMTRIWESNAHPLLRRWFWMSSRRECRNSRS